MDGVHARQSLDTLELGVGQAGQPGRCQLAGLASEVVVRGHGQVGHGRRGDDRDRRDSGLSREFTVRDGPCRRRPTAVDHLTVRIESGETVSDVGANGAGESTTIRMLTGILVPTRGTVTICGLRLVRDRRRLARQVGVVCGQRCRQSCGR
jgi:ABC-type glutathione transport system ATPase component